MNMQNYIELAEDEFDQRFTLIVNPFDKNAGWNGCFFETYGDELEFVRIQNPGCIWTMIDGDDGRLWLVSGYHYVNRINYLISIEQVPADVFYQIPLD